MSPVRPTGLTVMRTNRWSDPYLHAPDEPVGGAAPEPPPLPEGFVPPPGVIPDPAPGMQAAPGDVVVLVGTTKGLFALSSGPGRDGWSRSGPWFPGEEIAAAALDTRGGRNRLMAGAMSWHFGPSVYTSDDLGGTWREPEPSTLRFPDDTGASVARVWQLVPAADGDPDVVWAGVEPAALFRSADGGHSFELVRELWDHPHRSQWQPGGGGLCLHTIVPDPDGGARMGVAVSAAGFYRTLDGTTWEAANRGILPPFLPPPEPEFGQCVHKVAQHPTRPDTLYVQHHWGVYRSDDFGGTWTEVGEQKLPSTFGFPIVVDPNDPDTAYVIPLKSDFFRCAAEGKLRVFRTTDGGGTWEPSGTGLPDEDAYLSVLRDGFDTDGLAPAGLYLGTRTGEVFGSVDGGETWSELTRHLPPVLCVKAAVLG